MLQDNTRGLSRLFCELKPTSSATRLRLLIRRLVAVDWFFGVGFSGAQFGSWCSRTVIDNTLDLNNGPQTPHFGHSASQGSKYPNAS